MSTDSSELEGEVFAHLVSYSRPPHLMRVEPDGSRMNMFIGPLTLSLNHADAEQFCTALNLAVLKVLALR